MTLSTRIETAVASLEASATTASTDSSKLHQIVHGSTTTEVVTESGIIPSVAKTIANMSTLNPRGAWATATAYAVKDMVVEGTSIYVCAIAHTSGVFATDAAAGKWAVHQGVTREDLADTADLAKGAAMVGQSVQVVNGVATLRTITPAATRFIRTRYHTDSGDGGYGDWRPATGAPPGTYTDNNGTIVVPTGGDGSAAWLRDYDIVDTRMFGMDITGVSNVTTKMLAFFTVAIADGKGHISSGTYLLTEGSLKFDSAFTDRNWPVITTDGYRNVIFFAANTNNSAQLEITNGTATSASFAGWRGGSLGGITFRDTSGAIAASRHGLKLQGVYKIDFGYMAFDRVRGDGIHITSALYGGTNPDPYNVALCKFEGVDADQCAGIAFNNNNTVGLTHWDIGFFRATNCAGGGLRGLGTCGTIGAISMGSNSGWAIDDGGFQSQSRFKVGLAEIDKPEYGIRINNGSDIDLGLVRIVHRFDATDGVYWPKTGLSFAYTASPSARSIRGSIVHRVEAGGVKANIGVMTNFNSGGGNVYDVNLNLAITDNAAFGFVDTDYYANLSVNSYVTIKNYDRVIVDQTRIPGFVASSSSTSGESTSTASAANDTFTVASNTDRWVTGMGVRLSTTDTLPAPLAAATNYWVIRDSATTIKFATSYANAIALTAIDLTTDGIGTHTILNTINTTGYAAAQSKVAFYTEAFDRGAYYDSTNSWFVAPSAGFYQVSAQLHLTFAAAGTRIRMGIIKDVGGVLTSLLESVKYSYAIGANSFELSGVISLNAGDRLFMVADQLEGTLLQLTGSATFNRFSAKAIGART